MRRCGRRNTDPKTRQTALWMHVEVLSRQIVSRCEHLVARVLHSSLWTASRSTWRTRLVTDGFLALSAGSERRPRSTCGGRHLAVESRAHALQLSRRVWKSFVSASVEQVVARWSVYDVFSGGGEIGLRARWRHFPLVQRGAAAGVSLTTSKQDYDDDDEYDDDASDAAATAALVYRHVSRRLDVVQAEYQPRGQRRLPDCVLRRYVRHVT